MQDAEIQQYEIVSSRRDSRDNLIWQTPVLSLTAQAFLFTIALDDSATASSQAISSFLAFLAAVASAQLMMKHRSMEESDAKWLHKFEIEHRKDNYQEINARPVMVANESDKFFIRFKAVIVNLSSYRIWLSVLLIFAAAALFIFLRAVGF